MKGKSEGHPDEIARVQTMQTTSQQFDIPKASFKDFWAHYKQWRFGKVLLGTAGSWFFLDGTSPSPLPKPNKTNMVL
jgi:PHS family inorganic phosphate transporter-like MFS transporter